MREDSSFSHSREPLNKKPKKNKNKKGKIKSYKNEILPMRKELSNT